MLTIRQYVRAESLEQAYELNQKKANLILGGMHWMKMTTRSVDTAIDLSGLGLDQIEETDSEYRLGAMVTLRQLELHPGLDRLTQGAMAQSVRHIVGVQFRNLATVGGSVFGRFGCFMRSMPHIQRNGAECFGFFTGFCRFDRGVQSQNLCFRGGGMNHIRQFARNLRPI